MTIKHDTSNEPVPDRVRFDRTINLGHTGPLGGVQEVSAMRLDDAMALAARRHRH